MVFTYFTCRDGLSREKKNKLLVGLKLFTPPDSVVANRDRVELTIRVFSAWETGWLPKMPVKDTLLFLSEK